ncbi:unnamed protein product [Arctia plantaginis]|uniref:Uncharacterized protein n=1 Tax=Arctia plantaginis TaxID=874455 RepID=A0A8S0Z0X0_ARCPL|nr:unnamed protein product [Arctia plantaginis]
MDTTPEKAAQVVALIEVCQKQSAVARQVNISQYSVRRVDQRYQETGGYERRRGSGRARATSQATTDFSLRRLYEIVVLLPLILHIISNRCVKWKSAGGRPEEDLLKVA